ncbi:uncharacterized protein F4812DRAFT_455832 [Daldinia caldariorum]|uniref:uncharacterized protein n=1 Tax=Daldinia caldariorum TaxID=326644 RepID=UPI0020072620|nr:uncharacterized protein F4812DRAFT_455832 [Daldinia caldariorum]KAI1471724.1 hypothetical protein F4812DRAFT_455832 [Daldinia caldariorum]
MSSSTSSYNRNQSVAEEISSTRTTSISDSKSHGSTFSRRHSPALRPAKVAKKDHEDVALFGIESNRADKSWYFPFNAALNIEADHTLLCYHPPPEASEFAKNQNSTPLGDKQAPSSGKASTMSSYPNPSTTDQLCDQSPSAETPSSHGSLDSVDKYSDDEDIDLEKAADDALSQWFGHNLQDDEFDATPGDTHDAGESCRSARAIRPLGDQSESSPSGGSILPGGRTSQSGSPPQNRLSVKNRNKKYRVQEGFSCPYRKRNPIRFNVRDHEKCANRSFPNMTELKKHLTSAHFKDRCPRCQAAFSLSSELMIHIRLCPYPPGSIPGTQDSDPEDGFGETVDIQLKSREMGQKIKNWVHLWEALFPRDGMIPDQNFDPVMEDYEVFDRYEYAKGDIAQDVSALLVDKTKFWAVDQEDLSQKITNLLQEKVETILARPKAFRQRREIPGKSPETGFVEVTEDNVTSDTSFGSDFQGSMLSTPRCSPLGNIIGDAQDEQRYVHGSQHIDLPSGSMNAWSMDDRFDFMLDSGINSHPDNLTGFGEPQMYNNSPIVAYDGAPWLQRDPTSNQSSLALMDTVSLTSNTSQPTVSNDLDLANWDIDNNDQIFINNLDDVNMGFGLSGN